MRLHVRQRNGDGGETRQQRTCAICTELGVHLTGEQRERRCKRRAYEGVGGQGRRCHGAIRGDEVGEDRREAEQEAGAEAGRRDDWNDPVDMTI